MNFLEGLLFQEYWKIKNMCYSEIIRRTTNEKPCREIGKTYFYCDNSGLCPEIDSDYRITRDICYESLAKNLENPDYCKKVRFFQRSNCYGLLGRGYEGDFYSPLLWGLLLYFWALISPFLIIISLIGLLFFSAGLIMLIKAHRKWWAIVLFSLILLFFY